MDPQEIIAAAFTKIRHRIVLILIAAAIFCGLLIWYALEKPVSYTSTSIIFPLTASNESSSSNVLSALMGGGDSKSFTEQGSVNIIELAYSRTTGNAVARARVPEKSNKTIASLLLKEYNEHRGFMAPEIRITDSTQLINWATRYMHDHVSALINKNNSFQFSYTGYSVDLVKTISYEYIDKISKFYIDLKREKARIDYVFASTKVDSLRKVIHTKDRKLIDMDDRTLFTNTNRLQYRVPTENLLAEKDMVRAQYANAVANQQNAAYKLQKATPLIKVLDSPDPPYDVQRKSPAVYGTIGFVIGFIIMCLIFASGIIWKYLKHESNKMIYGSPESAVDIPGGGGEN